MKRLFHPTLNAWKDVPEGDVEKWVKSGWSKSKPKHADDSESHKPGEFHSAPVAVEPLPSGVSTVVNATGKPEKLTRTDEKPSK